MTEPSPVTIEQIDRQWRPTLNPHYRLQWEEAQECYVLLYPEGMIKLNFSGGEILSLCQGEQTVEQIIASLKHKFPQAEGIEDDILEFLTIACNQQWLTRD